MNSGQDIERILDHWLAEGPRTIADRVVADTLAIVERTEQPRVDGLARRTTIAPTVLRLMAAAAIVAVVGAGLIVGGALRTDHGPAPLPSASPSGPAATGPRPSASAIARSSIPPRPAGATLLLIGVPMDDHTTYTTLSFQPAFTFRGSTGWQLPVGPIGAPRAEGPGHAYFLSTGNVVGDLFQIPGMAVIRPTGVISEGGATTGPTPPDLVAWFRARTDLTLAPPTPVTIGGLAGTMLEGTVRPGAKANSVGAINMLCSADFTPCDWSSGGEIGVGHGQRFRFIVVDVRGQTVVIADQQRHVRLDGCVASLRATRQQHHLPGPRRGLAPASAPLWPLEPRADAHPAVRSIVRSDQKGDLFMIRRLAVLGRRAHRPSSALAPAALAAGPVITTAPFGGHGRSVGPDLWGKNRSWPRSP